MGGDGGGGGEGDEKQRWKKQPPLPPKYSAQDEGVHPTAVSTVQHILHIYIYQVFPNSLVFVLKSHTKMSGKAVTGKLIFLVMFAKLFSKFCIYIINQAEELTVITNVII